VRRLEAWAVGAVLALATVGGALIPLQLPWFTEVLSARYSELVPSTALPLAEASRAFVVTGAESARITLVAAMTADAVTHLEDVRAVLAGANRLVLVLAIVLSAWVWTRGRRDIALLASALGAASFMLALGLLAAMSSATVDFDTFFVTFHGLFFAPGTWVFPSDSVLIRLFPEPFWMAAGIAWGALVVVACTAYVIGWALLRRGPRVGRTAARAADHLAEGS
jgi:integral membrane protein (TIGR01906 family)